MFLEDVVDARFSKVLPSLKPHGAQGARPETETAVFTFTRVPSAARTGKCVKILVILKPSTSLVTNTR